MRGFFNRRPAASVANRSIRSAASAAAAFGFSARALAIVVIAASAISLSILAGRTFDASAGADHIPSPHPGIVRDIDADGHDHDDVLHFFIEREGEEYFVEIHFYTVDGAKPDFDEIRVQMLERFPGASPVVDDAPGMVKAQYKVNSYWWPSHSATWGYNPADKPDGLSGDDAAIAAGAQTWNSSPASFVFSHSGATPAGTGACSGGGLDGLNTVGWRGQSGTVLAVTCTWFTTSTQPFTVVEFDMEFDPRWEWSTGTPMQFDVQSVATHEFGHALGLGHSQLGSAVMYATYAQGADKRALTQDDIDGAVAIYGTGSGGGEPPGGSGEPTATPSDTPPPGPTNTPTPTPTPPGPPPPPPGGNGGGAGDPSPTPTKTPSPTPTPTPGAVPPGVPGGKPPSPSPTPKSNPPGPTPTPIPPPASVTMMQGTSLMTWPYATTSAAVAVQSMDGQVTAIYGYEAASRTWMVYSPSLPLQGNTLKQLVQGGAYWLFSDSPVVIAAPE